MIGDKLIKVCGMTLGENIREVESLGVDLIGNIFYPKSPRCVQSVPDYLPAAAARVGVFVDVPVEEVMVQDIRYRFGYVQLHGNETPDYCCTLKNLGFKLIKAFSISEAADLEKTSQYEGLCEYYLFDTKTPGYGGSGNSFDWTVLDAYSGRTPFLLSGGIGPDSAAALKAFSHHALAGYDLNSRFETAPGVKSAGQIKTFLEKLK